VRKIALFITRLLISVFYRVEITGRENIPETGAAIICANHSSQLDMFFLGCRIKRWIHWMAKEELFQNPLIGKILSVLGAFPVKRGKGDVGSIKTALKLEQVFFHTLLLPKL
jgi:1-acyl-sn-glycerol-3-phosphate acyltransferase